MDVSKIFKKFDSNQDGVLELDEVKKLLKSIKVSKKLKRKSMSKKKSMSKRKSVFKPYSKKSCPKGSISRVKYQYRKKTGKLVKVRPSCVRSKSLRSKGIKPKRAIKILTKGALSKFGYHLADKQADRRIALEKAVQEYGSGSVIKKLNAVRTLSKNVAPKNSKRYSRDIKFVQKLAKK